MGGPDIVKGNLTTAIDLLTGSFVHQALSGTGPFTLFLMVDSAFANLTHEQVNNNITMCLVSNVFWKGEYWTCSLIK